MIGARRWTYQYPAPRAVLQALVYPVLQFISHFYNLWWPKWPGSDGGQSNLSYSILESPQMQRGGVRSSCVQGIQVHASYYLSWHCIQTGTLVHMDGLIYRQRGISIQLPQLLYKMWTCQIKIKGKVMEEAEGLVESVDGYPDSFFF
jgi:hypothetical protein